MKKSILVIVSTTLIIGCKSLGTKSLPVYTYYNTLDEKAVSYMRNVPTVDLSSIPSQKERPNQKLINREIMFAVSGGGSRAAAFTLGVMAELENLGKWTSESKNINALAEIDYFTTVSGGGWGVAAYLTDLHFNNSSNYRLNDRLSLIQKNFEEASKGKIKCLSKRLSENITKGIKFGDIFNKKNAPVLPYFFPIATVLPSQSPFLFSDEFLDYYKIDNFYACDKEIDINASEGFANIDVAYAIATSGSVPAFHHSSAKTNICEKDTDMYLSSFCSSGNINPDYSHMILADGGIYDNYGYLTAIEMLGTLESESKTQKVLIIIDADADTTLHFVKEITDNSLSIGKETLFSLGFPARTTTFNRLRAPILKAMNIDSTVIDFFSTSEFTKKSKSNPDKCLLDGLDALIKHASNNISCFADSGKYLKATIGIKDKLLLRNPKKQTQEERNISSDCLANNFYRSGLMNKTSYLNDKYYYQVLTQLGKLAVRMNADKIYKTMYGK